MTTLPTPAVATLPEGCTPGGRFNSWTPRPVSYVLSDVDGTLVGPEPLARPQVVAAIAQAEAAGLRVGYATGRMRDAVTALHDQLCASGPHVFHNGSEVRSAGVSIATSTLTAEQVDVLLGVAGEHDQIYAEVYVDSGFHASAWDERARPHWQILGAEPLGIVAAAAELSGAPVLKVTFAVFDPAATPWLLQRLERVDVEVGAAGSPLTPHLTYVNTNKPGATKGAAVRSAASYLGVDLEHVAAIGDASNDLSMLEVVGTAIAMGQAPAQVKAAAHLVVPDVTADGAAAALAILLAGRGS